MQEIIPIKPHHFVDIITSIGSGQNHFKPHPYGHAVHMVAEKILNDPEILLEMELGVDEICKPCVHNKDGLCDDTIDTSFRPDAPSLKRQWNLLIDKRWCKRLRLGPGDQLTARAFCQSLRDVPSSDLNGIYREIPAERTAERAEKLKTGVEKFLT